MINRNEKTPQIFLITGVTYFLAQQIRTISSVLNIFTSLFGMGRGGSCLGKTPAKRKTRGV